SEKTASGGFLKKIRQPLLRTNEPVFVIWDTLVHQGQSEIYFENSCSLHPESLFVRYFSCL
ncbi:MAG: hypothetical protein MI892_28625, partial [Desulfobacterales bacterium]|nr:hypothetical protein [Desulfobacterales bacterium]